VDIDQARLRPHLRIRARRAKADDLAHAGTAEARWYRLPVDPRGLRGVPVIGVAAGAIAGTQPEAALLASKSLP
jgi:hypothetical protein